MAQMKHRWLRRLVKATAWTAAILLVLGAAFQWWIGPAVVRWQASRRVSGFWDGTVAIGGVDMMTLGQPMELKDVAFYDRQGREWLRIGRMEVSLETPWSFSPVVTGLRVSNTEVIAHCDGGVCHPPLLGASPDDWTELLDIEAVVANDTTLTVQNDGEVVSRADVSLVSYRRKAGAGSHLALRSSLGTFEFSDIQAKDFVPGENSIEVGRLTGKLGGGRVILTGRADKDPNGQWQATGRVVATQVDLKQLGLRISGGGRGIVTGMADVRLALSDPNGLTGKGMAFIEGADLSGVALAKALLQSAGLKKSEMLTSAEGEGLFHLRGATLTLDQARVSLPLAAVDFESGAKINVVTGQFDAVAVVMLFERVRDMMKRLPLVGLMVDLTERFSRLRVRGFWQDDESIQVTPAATGNVTTQTRKFLTDAARGRKRLGRGILDALGMPKGDSAPTSMPASSPAARVSENTTDKPAK